MRDFKSILVALKIYLSGSKQNKIYDKDVAKVLGISQMNFATIKRRNSIPYENIILFCKEEEIACCDIFFD